MSDKVLNTVNSGDLFNGKVKDRLLSYAERVGKNMCPLSNPIALSKAIDMNGFVLNTNGICLLRHIRHNSGPYNDRGQGWIASEYKMQLVRKAVEDQAKMQIPFEAFYDSSSGIEGIHFDFDKLLNFILVLYEIDLEKFSKENPVQIAYTLDGADLTQNQTHLTCGIKIVDPRAINPESKLPIGIEGSHKIQSRENCHVFYSVLAKDKKDSYKNICKPFFDFITKCRNDPRIKIVSPQDMSSMWKSVGQGGAAKVSEHFCLYCSCTSTDISKPRLFKCSKCEEKKQSLLPLQCW
jgi:hypothetical protein